MPGVVSSYIKLNVYYNKC